MIQRTILLVLMALLVAPCVAAEEDNGETKRSPIDKLTKRDRLYDVQIVGTHVWIVGFPGIILHSSDAGVTWEEQAGGAKNALFAMDFVDDKTGWIVGRYGLVLHTKDGGATWTPQKGAGKEHLFDLDFIDANHGWAVGNFGTVLRTADGGKSWARLKITLEDEDEEVGGYDDEDEGDDDDDDEDDGYGIDAEADEADEADETDNNQAPTVREGADEADEAEEEEPFDRLLNGVKFLDAKRGFVVGESGVILYTEDGGNTWAEQDSGEWAPLYSVAFDGQDRGFTCGSDGALLSTTDSGESWEKLESGVKDHLLSVIITTTGVLAVGRRGVLIRETRNSKSETSFVRVPLGVYTWIDSIAMSNSGVGLLIGGQGLIMRTEDGGKTWTRLGD